jgi:hypothetical protein
LLPSNAVSLLTLFGSGEVSKTVFGTVIGISERIGPSKKGQMQAHPSSANRAMVKIFSASLLQKNVKY